MEVKNIYKDASWYASYENSEQGKSLILCQRLKLEQLSNVITLIKGEIELAENPKEHSAEEVLASIKALIEQIPEVSYTEGFFKWVG
jgi:hypothetical protein